MPFSSNNMPPWLTATIAKQILVVLIFASWFLFGVFNIDDYGVTWDEEASRKQGIVSFNYIQSKLGADRETFAEYPDVLSEYPSRYHGVLFDLPMYYLERLFGFDEVRQYYLLRHFAVFCLFWLATVVFYQLLYRQFEHRGWAMLGVLMLVLSPRIFAHSFFNMKDSVFLSFYLFSLAALLLFLDRLNIKSMLLLALVSAMTVCVRNVGILVPLLSIGWILFYVSCCVEKHQWFYVFGKLLPGYLVSTSLLVIFFWPYLWENPLAHFIEAYKVMGNYQWDGPVLLFGKYYSSIKLPWFYLPAWFAITVPLVYLCLFTFVFLSDGISLLRRTINFDLSWINIRESRLLAISLSFFLLPVVIVISKNSTLYDGWRHLFFIYPPFLISCVIGARKIEYLLKNKLNGKGIYFFRISLGISLFWIFLKMVEIHPHQQVYFNIIAGGDRLGRYELDYWGASYQQGLRYLLKEDRRKCVKIIVHNPIGFLNVQYLPENLREKVCVKRGTGKNYDYYLTNFRTYTERQYYYAGQGLFANKHFFIEVDGAPILGVFKAESK